MISVHLCVCFCFLCLTPTFSPMASLTHLSGDRTHSPAPFEATQQNNKEVAENLAKAAESTWDEMHRS